MNLFDLEIQTGQLKHRVALQQSTGAPDIYGQIAPTWATIGTFWAFIKPLSGRELVNADQLKAEASHGIVMRWNPDVAVDPTLRLTMGARTFNISAALNIEERNVKLLVLATEQIAPQ